MKERAKEDERVLLVELTEAGEALKAKAAEVPHKVGACIPLDPDDAKELYRLLYTLLDRLR